MDLRIAALATTLLAGLACAVAPAWAGARVADVAQRPQPEVGGAPLWAEPEPIAASSLRSLHRGAGVETDAPTACGQSPEAQALAELIMSHPLQARPRLHCNALLSQVAAAKAREMAERGQVSHATGVTPPNMRLRRAGYALPQWYPRLMSNQVESIAGGFDGANNVLSAWMESPPHRAHLLAEHSLYLEQNEIGVGFHYDPHSEHGEYWVVYIARRAGTRDLPPGLWADKGELAPDKR